MNKWQLVFNASMLLILFIGGMFLILEDRLRDIRRLIGQYGRQIMSEVERLKADLVQLKEISTLISKLVNQLQDQIIELKKELENAGVDNPVITEAADAIEGTLTEMRESIKEPQPPAGGDSGPAPEPTPA